MISLSKSVFGALANLSSKNALNVQRLAISQQHALITAQIFARRDFSIGPKLLADDDANRPPTEGEKQITGLLKTRFPKAKTIEVVDISGGCGSMYEVFVESVEFKGMRKVKQHQLVNEALRKQIRDEMHGLRIHTLVPEESS